MTYDEATQCPLCWPDNWPRTNPSLRTHSRFGEHTVTAAFDALRREMDRMGVETWRMSTNIPRTQRGALNATMLRPADPGVAVWFKRKQKSLSMACDRWLRVEDNIWSIAKSVEAIRGIERWGASEIMERAFRGFAALPGIGESSGMSWWKILGVPVNATPDQVKSAFRGLAKQHHPDVALNGERGQWDLIQTAYQQFEMTQPK